MMAKIVENGRIVKMPEEYRFSTDEVVVNKIGEIVLLIPRTHKWNLFMQAIDIFSDDFMEDRS